MLRAAASVRRSDKLQNAGQAVPFLQVVKAADPDHCCDCYSDSDAHASVGPEGAAQQHHAAVAENLGWLGELHLLVRR